MGIWGDSNDGEDVVEVEKFEINLGEELEPSPTEPALAGDHVTVEVVASVNQFQKGDRFSGSKDEEPIKSLLVSGVAVVVD